MNQTTYTVTLADGTQFTDLTMNGNSFISQNTIDSDIFTDNCSPVTILSSDDETEIVHENMECAYFAEKLDGTHFALVDIPENVLATAKMQSDIEYIALMSDIEL